MIHFIYCAFSCINLNFYYLRILFLCPSTIFYLFNYYYNYFILQLLVHKSRLFELHINLNAFFLVFICFLFHELSLSLFSFLFFTIKLNVMSFYLFMGLMPSNEFLLSARTALWRTAWWLCGFPADRERTFRQLELRSASTAAPVSVSLFVCLFFGLFRHVTVRQTDRLGCYARGGPVSTPLGPRYGFYFNPWVAELSELAQHR